MTAFLIQILAMGLTASQLLTKPVAQFRTHLDPQTETAVAERILKSGCGVIASQFDDPRFNIEVLLSAMATTSSASAQNSKQSDTKSSPSLLFKKIDFSGMLAAYKLFCKGDQSQAPKINLSKVLEFYNNAFLDLKDVNTLKNFKLSEGITVQDGEGKILTNAYGSGSQRINVPLAIIPPHVRQAFIAAEDQDFYTHKGIDLKGMMRAFSSVASGSDKRPQGGSTITQQLAKNLLTGDDLTIERKMREMLLAKRMEEVLTKDQILELYLNMIYLGRASWGIEMAAKSYFGPNASASNLTIEQAALLAGLTKGPTFYNPDTHPDRAIARRQYVLTRLNDGCTSLKKTGCLSVDQVNTLSQKPIGTVPFESPNVKSGYYFLDAISRELRGVANVDLKTQAVTSIQSTAHTSLQRVTERALRDGLMNYERSKNRKYWTEPEGSIASLIKNRGEKWQDVLPRVTPRSYDVPWTYATVLDLKKRQVGLKDGRVISLRGPEGDLKKLSLYDLVFVDVSGQGSNQIATLIIPPVVQGAAIVLENKTGRVLAISGGFSYGASQYNRAIQAMRQPGSAIKPFVYLTALNEFYQPNTLLPNLPDPTLNKKWAPRNYERKNVGGLVTFRTAIEHSMNLPTIQLTARLGGAGGPYSGLEYVQHVFQAVGIYNNVSEPNFSQVLGSRVTRLIDLATAYATLANVGMRPNAHFIESVHNGTQLVYKNTAENLKPVEFVDRVAFYQIKKILEGTVARGTAVRMKSLTGYVAGKTGTSNNESDAWFACFTNDITIAVWVGYDDKKIFSNLGSGSTGARVALPIAEKILRASFEVYRKPQKLAGPPDDIKNEVREFSIDMPSGELYAGYFNEIFRLNSDKTPIESRLSLLHENEKRFYFDPKPETSIQNENRYDDGYDDEDDSE